MNAECRACNGPLEPEQENEPLCKTCEAEGLKPYATEAYRKFVELLHREGFDVWHYRGRFFYNGPAVTVTWEQMEHLKALLVGHGLRLQHDNLGLDWVLYPQ